jgi:hypothetical protein
MHSRKRPDPVYRVSGVRESRTEDVRRRQRRYGISMGIRTLCFLAALVTHGPARWVLFTGALVLPYVAVVIANSGRLPTADAPVPVVLPSRTQLPPLGDDRNTPPRRG